MLNRSPVRGFTLIELLVALTIVGIGVAMAMPSFSGMLQNAKLGSSTKSYLLGIQTARAEAIRRNLPVEFVLTSSPAASGAAATPAANGQNWVVRVANPVTLIEAKSAQEGSGQSGGSSVLVAGTSSGTFAGTVAFNGLGATTAGEAVTLDVTNPAGGDCVAAGGPMRCQRIQVRPGGQVHVCDPHAATGDSRACPP